jgi:hypothetical protein
MSEKIAMPESEILRNQETDGNLTTEAERVLSAEQIEQNYSEFILKSCGTLNSKKVVVSSLSSLKKSFPLVQVKDKLAS